MQVTVVVRQTFDRHPMLPWGCSAWYMRGQSDYTAVLLQAVQLFSCPPRLPKLQNAGPFSQTHPPWFGIWGVPAPSFLTPCDCTHRQPIQPHRTLQQHSIGPSTPTRATLTVQKGNKPLLREQNCKTSDEKSAACHRYFLISVAGLPLNTFLFQPQIDAEGFQNKAFLS